MCNTLKILLTPIIFNLFTGVNFKKPAYTQSFKFNATPILLRKKYKQNLKMFIQPSSKRVGGVKLTLIKNKTCILPTIEFLCIFLHLKYGLCSNV